MKQKKKLLSLVLVAVLMFGLVGIVMAANTGVSVIIDSKPVTFTESDGAPFIDENSRTLVPLRKVMETFGCIVEWDQNSRTAYVVKDGVVVTVTIGQKYIRVNGMSQEIDTCAVAQNDRTYLPIRAVLEAFGATVDWDSVSRAVVVFSPAAEEPAAAKDGVDGKDGADGKDGKDGLNGKDGKDGKDGVNGKDGANGKDGVSVTDAKINENGNLIITLSDGKTINAGPTSKNQTAKETFADYEVGTRFYLESPKDEFDAPVLMGGENYTVHFSETYYELIAKYDNTDPRAWDGIYYVPYHVKVHIQGTAPTELAGKKLEIHLLDSNTYQGYFYNAVVNQDGSFVCDFVQGPDNHHNWNVPTVLYYSNTFVR